MNRSQRRAVKCLRDNLAQAVIDRSHALKSYERTSDPFVRSVLIDQAERAERRAVRLDRAIRASA